MILTNTPNDTKAQQELKSNTIQCIGYLLEAVQEKHEEFKEDAMDIAKAFISLLQPGVLREDDPQISSISQALTQVSAILKDDFLPFMPQLMEKLLKDVVADVDFKLEDNEIAGLASTTPTELGVTSISVQMKGIEGNKKLSLNTNALEAKINSVQVIRELAKNLGTSFYQYIEPTWSVIQQVFSYQYSKNVREGVWETCQYLVEDCPDHSTKTAFYKAIFPSFKDRIEHYVKKRDHTDLTNLLNALLHCTKPFTSPGFIESSDIQWLFDVLGQSAWLCELEKDQRKIQFEQDKPTLDEEDYKEFEQTIDDI